MNQSDIRSQTALSLEQFYEINVLGPHFYNCSQHGDMKGIMLRNSYNQVSISSFGEADGFRKCAIRALICDIVILDNY